MRDVIAIFLFTALATPSLAHSWNDVYYVKSNPSVLGYPRAYPGHIDDIMVRKLTSPNDGANMCQGPGGTSADNTAYTSQYPMLSVNAGDSIETTYTENGHTTKDVYPSGKVEPGQTQFYWTGDPAVQMVTYGDLTDDRKLGDPQNFDDGLCAEDNTKGRNGPLPCKNSFTIPAGTKSGIYQVVWLWKFTKFGDTSHFEWYSTCSDFKVNGSGGDVIMPAAASVVAAIQAPEVTAAPKSAGDFISQVVVSVTSSKVFGTCKRKISLPTGT